MYDDGMFGTVCSEKLQTDDGMFGTVYSETLQTDNGLFGTVCSENYKQTMACLVQCATQNSEKAIKKF